MKMVYLLKLMIVAGVLLSCQSTERTDENVTAQNETSDTAKITITAQKLYDKLENPWGLVWLPDGRLLVTERAGEILVFKDDKFTGEKLTGVPEVLNKGQGGLLDINLHPDYANNGWIYI